ncbi:MAG TPA: DoxX family protein [Chitinophagaceae bacterium]|nr:DoxX family protein [Chitinophagaceae bacterium]
MKYVVNAARVLVGFLFVFSGLVKAIDPLGLAYKMQEFFEVWAAAGYMKNLMESLYDHALLFSVLMIALEVVLGIALLVGWSTRFISWLLLLLTLFFTFLTAYVLFSGKIRACGCFGDCIPLTPVQTFTKDIILLVLVLLILLNRKYIIPLFSKGINLFLVLLSLAAVLGLQWYVLRYLPIVDCLPFKKGNNILELRKMPKGAIPDKYEYVFVYKKNGLSKEFTVSALPDSSWEFVERKQELVQKGENNIPLINDFSLTTQSGNDTTEALLSTPDEYYLLFMKEYPGDEEWGVAITYMMRRNRNIPHYIVTAQPKEMDRLFNRGRDSVNVPILSCDGTSIKTAARTNPALYLMKGPVVLNKWGWPDFKKNYAIGRFRSMGDVLN